MSGGTSHGGPAGRETTGGATTGAGSADSAPAGGDTGGGDTGGGPPARGAIGGGATGEAGTAEGDGRAPDWLQGLLAAVREARLPAEWRPPAQARAAAVLVLFGDDAEGPDLLFIERAATLTKHAGQPAFPGGAIDPGDDGPVGAALREAAEETGLDQAGVRALATLPELHVPRSGYRVTPVVAWWHTPSAVAPNDPGEVAAVARIPIARLVDPANRVRVRHPGGTTGPAFRVAGMLIWGFTAGLLDRLLAYGGWERPWGDGPVEDLPPDVLALARRG
jgi:8-oxo-dGTP pyrophosphatase MutT (NUDIX family)